MKRAVVLLSGGLDSATVLAIARERGFDCYALSVRYGQRHIVELRAARRVAKVLGVVKHEIAVVDLRWVGGSALTDNAIEVPKDRAIAKMDLPSTYVPARNALFLCHALAWGEALGARDVFIGANALDYSGYPDCRPEFIEAFERMARLGTRTGSEWNIHAPLVKMTKAEIIREGARLGVDYSLTHSCYDPIASLACGRCDSCLLRRKGFKDAGFVDPISYDLDSVLGAS